MDKRVALFIRTMKEKQLKLALAESVTCGLAAHLLSGVPGTSDVLAGSVVCYTPEVKTGLLGISKAMIKKHSCESMEVTEALAKKLPKLIGADVYAAITGLASKGGSETKDKPVGTVFLVVSYQKKIFRQRIVFRGSPLVIRKKACYELYRMILENIR
jgi:nicotinamide-nucleotide amidase